MFTFRNLYTNMKNSSNMHVYEFFCSLYKEETFLHIYAGRKSWKTLQLSNLSILPASAETVALCCQKMAKKLAWWRPIHLKFLVERNLIGDNYFIYSLHLLASFFAGDTKNKCKWWLERTKISFWVIFEYANKP